MPRTKAEIISDMVDGGFSEDEIRAAFRKPGEQAPAIGTKKYSFSDVVERGPMSVIGERIAAQPTFGGKAKEAYEIASIPSKFVGSTLRSALSKIPDPERQSFIANLLLGSPKAVGEIGADFAEAALSPEQVALSVLPLGSITKAVGGRLGKAAGVFGRAQSGVSMGRGEALFHDPSAFFTKTKESAGKALGAIRKDIGFTEKREISEILGDISAKKGLSRSKKVIEKLEKLELGSGKGEVTEGVKLPEILRSIQDVQRSLRKTPFSDPETRYELSTVVRYLTDQLKKIPGSAAERQAAKQFSRSAMASEFRNFVPRTKAGDVSQTRTALVPILSAGGGFGAGREDRLGRGLLTGGAIAAMQSPLLGGLGIAGAGGVFKAAQGVLRSPALRTAIIALLKEEKK